jgi:ketosteroid isomerase-like protein
MPGMAHDTLALCREAYDTYSRGDFAGLLEFFDPDIEVYVAPPNFESGTYRGHAEYLRLIERWGAAWEEMRTEPRGMEAAGDWVLARVDYIGRGKDSAVDVTQPSWELTLWRDGQIQRYEVYFDRDDGARAFEQRSAGESRAEPADQTARP